MIVRLGDCGVWGVWKSVWESGSVGDEIRRLKIGGLKVGGGRLEEERGGEEEQGDGGTGGRGASCVIRLYIKSFNVKRFRIGVRQPERVHSARADSVPLETASGL